MSAAEVRVRGHMPPLDGVRGLAILLVLIYHCHPMHFGLMETVRSGFDFWALSVVSLGWSGVDLFFVLSGFLITGILYDSKGGAYYFRNFYMRRLLRVFPLYYGVVFFTFVIFPQLPLVPKDGLYAVDQSTWWWYVLYLSNFLGAMQDHFGHRMLAVTWSLAIEEQFYMVWPMLVGLMSRRGLMRLCVGLVVGAFLFRIALWGLGFNATAIYAATPARMDTLAIGAWIALYARGERGLSALIPWARRAALVGFVGMAGAVLFQRTWNRDPYVQLIDYSLIAVGFGGVLVLALASRPGGPLHWFFTHPIMRSFGKYSYAIYLFHVPAIYAMREGGLGLERLPPIFGSLLPAVALFTLIYATLVWGIAWLSWQLFEKHFLQLKRYFPTARGRSAQPAVPSRPGIADSSA